jgi:hypothetical protein
VDLLLVFDLVSDLLQEDFEGDLVETDLLLVEGDFVDLVEGDLVEGDFVDLVEGDLVEGDLVEGDLVEGDLVEGDLVEGDFVDLVEGDLVDGDLVEEDLLLDLLSDSFGSDFLSASVDSAFPIEIVSPDSISINDSTNVSDILRSSILSTPRRPLLRGVAAALSHSKAKAPTRARAKELGMKNFIFCATQGRV